MALTLEARPLLPVTEVAGLVDRLWVLAVQAGLEAGAALGAVFLGRIQMALVLERLGNHRAAVGLAFALQQINSQTHC